MLIGSLHGQLNERRITKEIVLILFEMISRDVTARAAGMSVQTITVA